MTRLLIAQPTTGTVVSGTVGYLMALAKRLGEEGIGWDYKSTALSDIALSRNIFASLVLAEPEYSHLLFIDSDMGFTAETVLGLLAFDAPVVAAACPKRYLSWDLLREQAEAEAGATQQRRPTQALIDEIIEFNVDTTRFDGTPWVAERQGDFLKVPAVGTGIMLIRRDVLEKMHSTGVARHLAGHDGAPLLGERPYIDFFSQLPTPDGRLIESEDISFCRRWVEDCGGEVWVDTQSLVMHFGMRGHSGRYAPRVLIDFPDVMT